MNGPAGEGFEKGIERGWATRRSTDIPPHALQFAKNDIYAPFAAGFHRQGMLAREDEGVRPRFKYIVANLTARQDTRWPSHPN